VLVLLAATTTSNKLLLTVNVLTMVVPTTCPPKAVVEIKDMDTAAAMAKPTQAFRHCVNSLRVVLSKSFISQSPFMDARYQT
jgi:hypothetical protein